ncbi:MAG: protein kinase [Polyangiaceae bacterium]|nr:protein kinase [Polyangiaceae bacterium]
MSSAETEGVPGAKPGDILHGKYRVDKVLGAGGMGVVVAATHLHLEEKVAIKFLLPDAAKSKDVVERFKREGKAAVKIKSEHVARVSDVGELDNGSPFMVMEFLHGQDLAQMVEERGALPVAASVEYVLQACEALAEAHALGIVHRDLKPANLFLTHRADGSPCIKVLDFGISKMVSSMSSPGMTKTTAVMGSPLYMSPEQMKSSKDVDHRTDIWSLGAILYELLSGNPPFIADTMPQLCLMILQEPLPPIGQVRHDVPAQLEQVIQRCQAKEPHHRFQNVAELAAALTPFVQGRARLSAERIADVLRGAAGRGSLVSTPTPAPVAGSYGPAPTVPQTPYGVSSPHLSGSNPHMQPGYTQQGYVAQAQTSGNFSQSNPAHGMGAGATVMAGPGMQPMGGGTMHAGPPMGASTASSWEGSLAPKKKSSAGLVVGIVAGIAVLAGVAIAVILIGGGSGGGNAQAGPTVTTSPESTPGTGLVPTVALGGDAPQPTATTTPTTVATAEPPPAVSTQNKPGVKPKPTATATATATTSATTAPTTTVTKKPGGPVMDDDRK